MTTTLDTRVSYRVRTLLGLWLAAALPMGLLAWVVVPAVAGPHAGPERFAVCLISGLTIGLAWQFVLVLIVARREGGRLRDRLWLRGPARRRDWCWAGATLVAVGLVEALPIDFPGPADRDLGVFLGTGAGHRLLHGNWALFALVVLMFVLNTVIGEELFFRGLLLPRMPGRRGVLVNAVMFGLYHLHQPWSIPSGVVTGVILAGATQRWRSSWFGIVAHSGQSLVFTVLLVKLVA